MVFIQEIIYLKYKINIYKINIDEYESIERHWIGLYVNAENATYSNSFGV